MYKARHVAPEVPYTKVGLMKPITGKTLRVCRYCGYHNDINALLQNKGLRDKNVTQS
jgi:hypothetical protein